MSPQIAGRRSQRGFSLLETLIAMMILSAGIILLSSSWSGSYGRLNKTKIKTEVAALLQRKMVEIDLEFHGKPMDSIPDDKNDDFGTEYPQYRWAMKTKELVLPDLTPVLKMGADNGVNEQLSTIMKQFSDHLQKSVKEVKVSVFYKPPKGAEIEYSVTTYYVDYEKQIQVPGMPGGGG